MMMASPGSTNGASVDEAMVSASCVWAALTAEERAAAATLGWATEQTWDSVARVAVSELPWARLSAEQRTAAGVLHYDEACWDLFTQQGQELLLPLFMERELGQVRNSEGGCAYEVDDATLLNRFLVLGSEGSTYHANAKRLESASCGAIARLIGAGRGEEVVESILAVSEGGRAAKQTATLTALALCCHASGVDAATRKLAFQAMRRVCRTGTMLFELIGLCEQVARGEVGLGLAAEAAGGKVKRGSGWGRAHRRAVSEWYTCQKPSDLAYQLTKYPGRAVGGQRWTHKDVLRLAHPKAPSAETGLLYRYVAKGFDAVSGSLFQGGDLLAYLTAVERAKKLTAEQAEECAGLVRAYALVREHVPPALLSSPLVWAALLERMPLMAMVRNLAKLTAIGLVAEGSAAAALVVEKLLDEDALRRARVHPFSLLLAYKVYGRGHGEKGSLSWTPCASVVEALQEAFTLRFKSMEPTGKRFLLAMDVSGSMCCPCMGSALVSCREASAAMATVLVNTEAEVECMAFQDRFVPLPIHRGHSLDDVLDRTSGLSFGSTDCALPMLWATEQRKLFDVIVVFTDSETWAGRVQPLEALRRYRATPGLVPDAKLIVVGMAQNEFSIADPSDAGMLDVVGFDAAAPDIMASFAKGEL